MYQLTILGRQSLKEMASFFIKCVNYLQRYTVGGVIFSNVINQILTLSCSKTDSFPSHFGQKRTQSSYQVAKVRQALFLRPHLLHTLHQATTPAHPHLFLPQQVLLCWSSLLSLVCPWCRLHAGTFWLSLSWEYLSLTSWSLISLESLLECYSLRRLFSTALAPSSFSIPNLV